MPANITFEIERLLVTDAQLTGWFVSRSNGDGVPTLIEGPCPSCGHTTEAEIALDVPSEAQSGEGAGLPPARTRITRVVECQCGCPHARALSAGVAAPASPPTEPSCGRWWLGSVLLTADDGQPVVAGDESLLQAARALQAAIDSEEIRVRSSAEKWVGGTAALLSLFGLSTVVIGDKAFDGLSTGGAPTAGVLAAIALLAAGRAVFCSYKAAYGWPVLVDIGDDEKLREWFAQRRVRLQSAAADLKNGVKSAVYALTALACVLAITWFWPLADATAMVKVTMSDDSFVCGELLASKADGTVRIRTKDGKVSVQMVADVKRVVASERCAS